MNSKTAATVTAGERHANNVPATGKQEYQQYGAEWKANMARLTKAQIIDIAANIGKDRMELLEALDFIALNAEAANVYDSVFRDKAGEVATAAIAAATKGVE